MDAHAVEIVRKQALVGQFASTTGCDAQQVRDERVCVCVCVCVRKEDDGKSSFGNILPHPRISLSVPFHTHAHTTKMSPPLTCVKNVFRGNVCVCVWSVFVWGERVRSSQWAHTSRRVGACFTSIGGMWRVLLSCVCVCMDMACMCVEGKVGRGREEEREKKGPPVQRFATHSLIALPHSPAAYASKHSRKATHNSHRVAHCMRMCMGPLHVCVLGRERERARVYAAR